MAMKVTGFSEVKQNLNTLVSMTSKKTGQNALKRGLKNAAKPMLDAAKAMSPSQSVEASMKIDDKLDPKIIAAKAEKDAGTLRIHVGSGSPLAHLFEYGTKPRYHKSSGKFVGAMTPDPFMRPAFDTTADEVFEGVSVELNKAILASIGRASKAGKG